MTTTAYYAAVIQSNVPALSWWLATLAAGKVILWGIRQVARV